MALAGCSIVSNGSERSDHHDRRSWAAAGAGASGRVPTSPDRIPGHLDARRRDGFRAAARAGLRLAADLVFVAEGDAAVGRTLPGRRRRPAGPRRQRSIEGRTRHRLRRDAPRLGPGRLRSRRLPAGHARRGRLGGLRLCGASPRSRAQTGIDRRRHPRPRGRRGLPVLTRLGDQDLALRLQLRPRTAGAAHRRPRAGLPHLALPIEIGGLDRGLRRRGPRHLCEGPTPPRDDGRPDWPTIDTSSHPWNRIGPRRVGRSRCPCWR